MAKFAETYPDKEFVQQVVAQIPWGHNVVIMDKVLAEDERTWYLKECAKNGWSRNISEKFRQQLPSIENIKNRIENTY